MIRITYGFITAQKLVWEGNVFSHVCLSVHGACNWSVTDHKGTPDVFKLGHLSPPSHTSIGKWAVGLRMKGILVIEVFL